MMRVSLRCLGYEDFGPEVPPAWEKGFLLVNFNYYSDLKSPTINCGLLLSYYLACHGYPFQDCVDFEFPNLILKY